MVFARPEANVRRSGVWSSWWSVCLGALYVLSAIRVLAARRFFNRDREPASVLRWGWLAAGFSCVSGLLWGMLGWVGFLPEQPILFSFTVIVLTVMICGTVPSLSAFPPALVGSIIATVLPITVRSITNGGDISGAYLSLLAGLVAINLYYCRTTYHMLRETIRLRLENVELVSHLQEERDR